MKTLNVAVPDDIYERAEKRAIRVGRSLDREVVELIARLGEEDDQISNGSATLKKQGELSQELNTVAKDCSVPNWDGLGGRCRLALKH